MARVLAVIPARWASVRFPGKPLVDIAGKPMIQWVWERVQAVPQIDAAVVATDSERIFTCVEQFGGRAIMTRDDHPSGTDRLGEVAQHQPDFTHYLNVQGDEPLLPRDMLSTLLKALTGTSQPLIATLVHPLTSEADYHSEHVVKVVRAQSGHALYFSRSPVPHLRGADFREALRHQLLWRHVGVYGFSKAGLTQALALPRHPLEQVEGLEQLRWLGQGLPILTAETPYLSLGVDVPEDVARVEAELRRQGLL